MANHKLILHKIKCHETTDDFLQGYSYDEVFINYNNTRIWGVNSVAKGSLGVEPIPVPNYEKYYKPKYEEFWLWGLFFGIGAKIFELLDRISRRWAPIILPPWMIEQYKHRVEGQMT